MNELTKKFAILNLQNSFLRPTKSVDRQRLRFDGCEIFGWRERESVHSLFNCLVVE